MVKTAIKRILAVTALAGALLASLIGYKAAGPPDIFLTTSSPTGAYTVTLTGRKDRPRLPLFSHTVRFNLSKQGRPVLRQQHLHSGDWLDPSFEILYPQHTWEKENVLHFYRSEYFDARGPDRLVVFNETDGVISYLKVESTDAVLLFDVQPRSATEVLVSPPRADLKWVAVEGAYSEARRLEWSGTDFVVDRKLGGPFTYHVRITGAGISIESPQLKRYERSMAESR